MTVLIVIAAFLILITVTGSWLYLSFTVFYPILYLLELFFRHRRHKLAQKWNPKDKVVLITGASSGIGEALAHVYARHGSKLVLCARRKDLLESVAKKCEALGSGQVLALNADVTKEEDVKHLVAKVENTFGQLDCIVLNAGVSMGERFDSLYDLSLIRQIIDLNYMGAVNVTFHSLPLLMKSPKSRVLVNSSIAALAGGPTRTGYCGSKFGIRGFFESLQSELWENDIYVTIAYPGAVVTEINKNRLGVNPGEIDFKKAMSAEECARLMFEAVCKGEKEIVFTNAAKFVRIIEGVFPELAAFMALQAAKRFIKKRE